MIRLDIGNISKYRFFSYPFLAFALVSLLSSLDGFSQSTETDAAVANTSFQNAINYYRSSAGAQSALYGGVRHNGYTADIQGTPYLEEGWQEGKVYFDGILYEKVPLQYDELKDELLVLVPESRISISLISHRVERFNLNGHTFVNLGSMDNGIVGFYDLLRNGPTAVLVKRKKVIHEKTSQQEILRSFLSDNRYYLKKGDKYFQVRSTKDILSVLNDKKSEIRVLIKGRKLDVKAEPERVLTEIASYYDKLHASL